VFEGELNGFKRGEEVPEYRSVLLQSKGHFAGPLGAGMKNRPLPVLGVLEPEHIELLTSNLTQPIAAYEDVAKTKQNPIIPWPPELTTHYQSSYIQDYALVSAWQVLPGSLLTGLCEEVRNRLLRFSLEIKSELGEVGDKAEALPAAKVEAAVVNYIFGGTNVIAGAASQFTQIGTIVAGDFGSLVKQLQALNVQDGDIAELKKAIATDKQGFGERTKAWMKKVGAATMSAGGKAGVDVLKEALLQYFDLK
jgi:hypothetical protein